MLLMQETPRRLTLTMLLLMKQARESPLRYFWCSLTWTIQTLLSLQGFHCLSWLVIINSYHPLYCLVCASLLSFLSLLHCSTWIRKPWWLVIIGWCESFISFVRNWKILALISAKRKMSSVEIRFSVVTISVIVYAWLENIMPLTSKGTKTCF